MQCRCCEQEREHFSTVSARSRSFSGAAKTAYQMPACNVLDPSDPCYVCWFDIGEPIMNVQKPTFYFCAREVKLVHSTIQYREELRTPPQHRKRKFHLAEHSATGQSFTTASWLSPQYESTSRAGSSSNPPRSSRCRASGTPHAALTALLPRSV